MKKNLLFLLFAIWYKPLLGQTDKLKFLEDNYKLNILIDNGQENDSRKEGTLILYNKKNNQEIIRQKSDVISYDKKYNSNVPIDVSIISDNYVLLEDFNFDGVNDLGVLTFYSSKGPGYTVFLNKGNKFVNDTAFTNVILYSQGNFELDTDDKQIHTRTSGGCCHHAFATYQIENEKPILISESVEEIDSPYRIITTKTLKGKEYVTTVEKTIDLEDESIKVIMSFQLENKNKRAILYNINDRMLYYVFVRDDEDVEFNFPIEANYKSQDFVINKSRSEIVFKNKDTEYKIYQVIIGNKMEEVGVKVKVNGKEFKLKGDLMTLYGNLGRVPLLDNVVVK